MRTPSNTDFNESFSYLNSQIEEKAQVSSHSLTISARDYKRNMQRIKPGEQDHRYRYLNTWATDGIRVFRYMADTAHKPLPSKISSALNLGRIDNEDKLAKIKTAAGKKGPLAIVGIDPGHVYPAAAFALPTDPSKVSAQVKISKTTFFTGARREISGGLKKQKPRRV